MILNILQFSELSPVARRLICQCPSNGSVYGPYPPLEWKVNWIARCADCRKHHIQYLYECESCEESFVKDFSHPGFCYKTPLCWSCMPDDAYCHHCLDKWNERMLRIMTTVRPPLKPKVIIDPNFDPLKDLF